jgi:hypothetical protein
MSNPKWLEEIGLNENIFRQFRSKEEVLQDEKHEAHLAGECDEDCEFPHDEEYYTEKEDD